MQRQSVKRVGSQQLPERPVMSFDPEIKRGDLLTESQAAYLLNLSPRTLRNWRHRGGGPKFVKHSSRCIRYRRADLSEWISQRVRKSTSDLGIIQNLK
ncbi:helix-turn-helix transcriptional regulator [Hyphomonas sp.]|uniref:helix-turn-helix transcriptional regulator n=1 Tax=Hyphomonas sp. TaxID=87 RepID=UPI003D29B204